MSQKKNETFQVTKEIVVKFIEMGKISPTTFDKNFKSIYQTVKSTFAKETQIVPKDKK